MKSYTQITSSPTLMNTAESPEQRLAVAMSGAPELKRDEKSIYLGEFRERVIRTLSKKQVAQKFIYPEIIEALNHELSSRMLINGELRDQLTDKYIALAKQVAKPYTVIHDPELKGETGLAVISNKAVNINDIEVKNREFE